MVKPTVECTFDEIVDDATRRIHDALLRGGSREMRSAIWIAMSIAIDWRRLQDAKEKKLKNG
jgi:hypothetical protein